MALAATTIEEGEERIVADARFDLVGNGDAEAALLLRDDVAGRGLGTLLLDRLLERAAVLGVRRVLLDILPENRAMLALAHRVGLAVPFPPEIVPARFLHDAALQGAIALVLDTVCA